MIFSTLQLTFIIILFFYLKYTFFHQILHLHSHDLSIAKGFDPFVSVIILKTSIFKSFVLFGTHALLDKSLRLLQVLTDLSNLTANG